MSRIRWAGRWRRPSRRASQPRLLDRFHLEVVPSPSGVTHHLFSNPANLTGQSTSAAAARRRSPPGCS
ncbi:hypothetical protein SLUN_17570 [Streptomyces lunaelactis]|uniref:Uncharacterized protein n=1 Tax=Streptomyces lunaelactis TaxID=1535768 RepID=A0A2R4T3P3_9ACTN|nr:hypothetical protein SLUN_17570 [Streptomyces lunaelactis]